MDSPLYYRSQAAIAHRLASKVTDEDVSEILKSGIVEVPHRDLARQQR